MKKRIQVVTAEETVVTRTRKISFEAEMDFVQMYMSFAQTLLKYNPSCEIALLIYGTTHMDKNNYIHMDKRFKDSFNDFCKEYGSKGFSESHINKSLRNLVNGKSLIKVRRGVYRVNPYDFWRDLTSNRIGELKQIEYNEQNNN